MQLILNLVVVNLVAILNFSDFELLTNLTIMIKFSRITQLSPAITADQNYG